MTLLSGTTWLPEPPAPAAAPFVRTAVHGGALDTLRTALGREPRLALVSGEAGTGKTTLAHALAATLAADAAYAAGLVDVTATRGDLRLLRSILAALGDTPTGRSGLDLLTELRARVATLAAAGRRTVLLLDNAHALTGSQLEIVRSLLATPGVATDDGDTAPAIAPAIVLFATPELRDRIARRGGLASRLAVSVTLVPLDRDDLATLLHGRAASGAPPFSAAALGALAAAAGGIPGRALPLAAAAQAAALARGWEQVDERVVTLAAIARDGRAQDAATAATAPRPAAAQTRLPFDEAAASPRAPRAQLSLLGGEEGEA